MMPTDTALHVTLYAPATKTALPMGTAQPSSAALAGEAGGRELFVGAVVLLPGGRGEARRAGDDVGVAGRRVLRVADCGARAADVGPVGLAGEPEAPPQEAGDRPRRVRVEEVDRHPAHDGRRPQPAARALGRGRLEV